MRKKYVVRIGTIAAATLLVGGCSAVSEPAPDTIVIGLDEDSTGPGASYSVIVGDTVRAAVADINANGGVNGRRIVLEVGNDESDPTKTPSVIRRMIDKGASAVVLATGSGSVMQAKSVLQRSGIPGISPNVLVDSFAKPPDEQYSFMVANSLSQYAEVYCGAFTAEKYRTIAVLADSSAAIDGVMATLAPPLRDCVDITTTEKVDVDAADLTAQVSRLLETKPDAVLVASVGGHVEILAHDTLHRLSPELPRFSLASIGNQPKSWALADSGSLDGMVFMGSLTYENPRTRELASLVQSVKGPDYEPTAYDAQALDTVRLLQAALETVDDPHDRGAVRDALENVRGLPSSFGQPALTLSYGPDDHLAADSLCGLVLMEFGPENTPAGPWSSYQPPCTGEVQ
ncbi:ABC transporter substrate-binding protein [Prescottella sp. R16]|uniref:ABC transporter substrate-binding protein n=1 Tax=Prescottella sp. R16 TaxID=3064529 RepID=UPI00272E401F|nr:ABC transporter substrate-binding protein [Prescottella sp. R16]